MTLPFRDVDVFIKSSDDILHSFENRIQTAICDRKLYIISSKIRLWQAAAAVFMKTTVRIWEIPVISLLRNTF